MLITHPVRAAAPASSATSACPNATDETSSASDGARNTGLNPAKHRASSSSGRRSRAFEDASEEFIANPHPVLAAPQTLLTPSVVPKSNTSPSTSSKSNRPAAFHISGSTLLTASANNMVLTSQGTGLETNRGQNTQHSHASQAATSAQIAPTLSHTETAVLLKPIAGPLPRWTCPHHGEPDDANAATGELANRTPAVNAAAPATSASGGEAARIQTLKSSTGGLDDELEVNAPWRIGGSLKTMRVVVVAVVIVFLIFLGWSYTGNQLTESPFDVGLERSLKRESTSDQKTTTAPDGL